jgi:hypothetical protein
MQEGGVISQASVFGRRDRVMMQEVEGASVLLDIDSGEYFSLNGVGGRVWELCDGTSSVGSIAEILCAEFDVDGDTALGDTTELLGLLFEAGLVVGC